MVPVCDPFYESLRQRQARHVFVGPRKGEDRRTSIRGLADSLKGKTQRPGRILEDFVRPDSAFRQFRRVCEGPAVVIFTVGARKTWQSATAAIKAVANTKKARYEEKRHHRPIAANDWFSKAPLSLEGWRSHTTFFSAGKAISAPRRKVVQKATEFFGEKTDGFVFRAGVGANCSGCRKRHVNGVDLGVAPR